MRILTTGSGLAVALAGFSLLLGQSRAGNFAGESTGPDKPFPPHKIISNLYFVGTDEQSSFLIATDEGNILINSGYQATVPMIRDSVEKLAFRFVDTKILLGSHAHVDHMQGDALVKELTGARVMAMEQDVPALQKIRPGGTPHPIDRVLHDGDEVKLGHTTLVAHLTAGHTKGCTTWTAMLQEGGRTYNIVIVCGMGVKPGPHYLIDNPDYTQITDDYIRAFKLLRELPCDVFLGSHSHHYGMQAKYAKLTSTGPNPYIDPQGYKAHLDEYEKLFYAELAQEKQAAAK